MTGRPSIPEKVAINREAAAYWITRSSRVTTTFYVARWVVLRRETLPYRRRVLNPAGAPELVEAARNFQLRFRSDIAVVDFAVIADVADDAHGPVLGQPKLLAVIAFGADQPHHVGILRLQRLVDVFRVNAELFGVDHRVQRPLHDQHPVIVTLAHHRRQRFLRDDIRQDHMLAGLGQIEAQRIELGNVRRQHVALAGIVGLYDLAQRGGFALLVFHVVGAEIVGEVELRRGFRLHAYLAAVQLQGRFDVARPRDRKSTRLNS